MTTLITVRMTEEDWVCLLESADRRAKQAERDRLTYLRKTGRKDLLINKQRKKFIPDYEIISKETTLKDTNQNDGHRNDHS